ncbi:unnamed protein product [Soboliphyme baturini]|uniref:WH2 domain-containing protein n=1 Tax=Soboliphyme baturini TaxID=241478 RepID=A0A183IZC3_9BILA|nr:unnamed protein product [Soboliphyme baturini]
MDIRCQRRMADYHQGIQKGPNPNGSPKGPPPKGPPPKGPPPKGPPPKGPPPKGPNPPPKGPYPNGSMPPGPPPITGPGPPPIGGPRPPPIAGPGPPSLLLVDKEKAFDSVELDAVLKALVEDGVDENYVEIIKEASAKQIKNARPIQRFSQTQFVYR